MRGNLKLFDWLSPGVSIGDMQNEDSLLEWLIDDDIRELEGEIEAVNARMLIRLLEESPFMAVFFCK